MNSQASPKILFNQQEIETAVKKLAAEITEDYQDKNPLLIGVLKGAFVFMADLIRLLDFHLEIEFIRLSSYGQGRITPGELKVEQGILSQIRDREVLIVEDIVDTGYSAAFLLDYLGKEKPASLKFCALTDKPSRRKVPVNIEYRGLTVPDKFLVGYGLDCDEKFRNLPYIGYLESRD
ncbi:hypoxanthine phosphoribosyltransferase [Chloroflexota bacterium]